MRGRAGSAESGRQRRGPDRRQIGRLLPVAFLGLSLVVSGWGAFEAYRAQRSHAETARAVLTDYGEFAAWSYERRMGDVVGSALTQAFSAVRQDRALLVGTPTEADLARLLDEKEGGAESQCTCSGAMGGDFAFYVRLGAASSEPVWAGQIPAASDRSGILEAVERNVREAYARQWPFAVLYTAWSKPVAFVRLMPMAYQMRSLHPTGDTIVYGFEIDGVQLASLMNDALKDDALLPPTLTEGRDNRDVVQVDVLGPDGSVVFASHPGQPHAYPAEERLPAMLGGGVARASVLPGAADELIIGGLPRGRTSSLLLIFALAAVLAVAAIVQLRREHRLALLRQDFVASVSHELRTPLAQVRLFTETLRLGRVQSEEQRTWALTNIDRETLRLTQLVERILHFSRTERGVQPVERETVDLAEEVMDSLAAFTPMVPETRARFECAVPAGLTAEVDRDSLRQVLLNYLDNAVRYGPSGQTVRVVGEADARSVRLAVEDDGPGVPPREREAIFEPFTRGEATVGTVVSGSGIGLSVVRQIARAHQGRAWVDEAPGGGARFVLELPVLHTARPAHFPERSPEREGDAEGGGVEGTEVA